MSVFDQYQKSRMQFVQTVTDLASRPHNIEYLDNAGVLDLLCPLLWDMVPSIQQLTAIALGRLANHDVKIAGAIARRNNVLPQLVKQIDKQTDFFKKAALFLLRALAKHSPEMAYIVVSEGGLDAMALCLEDFNPGVKEAAAWAVGYISRHNKCLAQSAVDSGAVPLLVLCLQESELCLKQISTSALCDIGKHTPELAQTVVDAGAIPLLARTLANQDAKLKRQVLSALGCVAKHTPELAEFVVEAEIFPEVFYHMRHADENVAKAAATLTKEVCKHTVELARLAANTGGIEFLVELIDSRKSSTKLPAVMALGYIAGHAEQLASMVIDMKGVAQLALLLETETENHILAITVWALGQIGKHSPEHAQALAATNIFTCILGLYANPQNSEDLKIKCKVTLKQVLQKCMYIEALEPLLHDAPPNILKYILGQFSKILPSDARARRLFVTTGGLKKVQEIRADLGSTLAEYITTINCCFPEEIVRYYSPGYPDSLLEAVDQYQPNCSQMEIKSECSNEKSTSSASACDNND
ncbi:sperm-associated antigen 6-like [Copidosoma floridanum]|uniref:sperm-associated antigen 6-like n=1 Tax=Copidosoma floridanum TaxID=29053 RepID=UPI0006C958A9|nr:sperm-associated antigen 6-like [Copidosoma floridanum]